MCYGELTGEIDLQIDGGVIPYSYSWSNLSIIEDLVNVGAGNYTVTVTDDNNCTATSSVTITEPTVLASVITVDSTVSCFGGSNAGIHVTSSGGTPFTVNQANGTGYTYVWSNASTDTSSVNLSIGQHCVTITDSLGCSEVVCITLTQPTAIVPILDIFLSL